MSTGEHPVETVEDPDTGERYLMYSLPAGAWPAAARVVYECQSCGGRYPPDQWAGGCPGCADGGRRRRRRRKD